MEIEEQKQAPASHSHIALDDDDEDEEDVLPQRHSKRQRTRRIMDVEEMDEDNDDGDAEPSTSPSASRPSQSFLASSPTFSVSPSPVPSSSHSASPSSPSSSSPPAPSHRLNRLKRTSDGEQKQQLRAQTISELAYGSSNGGGRLGTRKGRGAALVAHAQPSSASLKADPLVSREARQSESKNENADEYENEEKNGNGRPRRLSSGGSIQQKIAQRNKEIERNRRKIEEEDAEGEEEEEEEVEVEEEEEDDDDDDEDYDAPSARRSRCTTRSTRQSSSRSRRRIAESSDEESASEDEEGDEDEDDEQEGDSEDEDEEEEDEDESPPPPSKKKSTAKPSSRLTRNTKLSSPSPPASSMLSRFLRKTNDPFSDHTRLAQQASRSTRSQRDQQDDEEAEEEAEEEEEEVQQRRSTRSGRVRHAPDRYMPDTKPLPSKRTRSASVVSSDDNSSVGRRSSSRARKQVNYREPRDNEGLEELEEQVEEVEEPSNRRRRSTQRQIIEVNDDDDDDDENEGMDAEDDDDAEDGDGDDFFNSAAYAKLTSRRSQARVKVTKKTKSQSKRSRRTSHKRSRNSESETDESESDEETRRAAERKWEREQGLLMSDADSGDESDSEEEADENPIEKILARRSIQIPENLSDPHSKSNRIQNRTEYLIKYKDLSYHCCDWVDRKTIELWKQGKTRLNAWQKREERSGQIRCYSGEDHRIQKLFRTIRQVEIKSYERDERDNINALIENEESRINKRVHPSLKTILRVWAPEAEGAIDYSIFFDPAYLEVERIIAERDFVDPNGNNNNNQTEVTATLVPSARPSKEYLVKWCNLPYDSVTWESDLALNDFVSLHDVESFHRRLTFPTMEHIDRYKRLVQYDERPRIKPLALNDTTLKRDGKAPPLPEGKELRDYQVEGVNWLIVNWGLGKGGNILADEMGLGKTVTTCSFLRTLFLEGRIRGPFLIIAPLSVTAHWQREFDAWAPELNAVRYTEKHEAREICREYEFGWKAAMGCATAAEREKMKRLPKQVMRLHCLITSKEVFRNDIEFFRAIDWAVLIVDEAHEMRNAAAQFHKRVEECSFAYKLFLTGTPIQNNLGELFTLLHLCDPAQFPSRNEFTDKYKDIQETGGAEEVTELHKIMKDYMFRRMKGDVEKSLPPREETLIEVEMTMPQRKWYRAIWEQNIGFLRQKGRHRNLAGLNNIAMQLRKVCNHCYLVNGVEEAEEEENQLETDEQKMEHMLHMSGKLILLDKLLTKLKSAGSKVLIFSQMVSMLNILEDFLEWRQWSYERLDGSTSALNRQRAIDRFQAEGNETFIFMLSTKAGGMGVTLTRADTIIIFDSDWNPQGDVQAIGRAHRIGQVRKVQVYRLICARTYEFDMFQRASRKLGLDHALLHTLDKDETSANFDKKEVESLLRRGAAHMLLTDDNEAKQRATVFANESIDAILEKNARTLNHNESGVGAASARSGLSSFTSFTFNAGEKGDQTVDFGADDFWERVEISDAKKKAAKQPKHAAKRARKQLYDLSRPEGRGLPADGEMSDLDMYESDFESDDIMDEDAGPARKRASGLHDVDDDRVQCSDVDDDVQEKCFSGVWSKQSRTRFLTALQRYGYDRLPQLRPYFPGLTLRSLQDLALSFIALLHTRIQSGKSSKQTPASVLAGRVRKEMVQLIREKEAFKAEQAAADTQAPPPTPTPANANANATTASPHKRTRLESQGFFEICSSFPIDPALTDPKFEQTTAVKNARATLAELNRLAILAIMQNNVREKAKLAASTIDGEAEASNVSSFDIPPPTHVDTSRHIVLPLPLSSFLPLPLPAAAMSHLESVPAPWWQSEHDQALLAGIQCIGWPVNGAKSSIWDRIRTQHGSVFAKMTFGKKETKKRASRAKEGHEEKEKDKTDTAVENDKSRDSATSDTAMQDVARDYVVVDVDGSTSSPKATPAVAPDPPPAPQSVDVSSSSDTAIQPVADSDSSSTPAHDKPIQASISAPHTDAAVPALSDATGTNSAAASTPAVTTTPGASDADATTPALPIWPTARDLRTRLIKLVDEMGKDKSNKMPSAKTGREPSKLTFNSVEKAFSASNKGPSLNDTLKRISAAAATPTPPTWRTIHVTTVIKTLQHFGRPTEQRLSLPAEFFDQPTTVDPTSTSTPSTSSSHTIVDSYSLFLTHCEFKSSVRIMPAHIQSLVTSIMDKAEQCHKHESDKLLANLKKIKSEMMFGKADVDMDTDGGEKTKQEDETDEDKKKSSTSSEKDGAPSSLEAILAKELTRMKSKHLLEKTRLLDDLKHVIMSTTDLRADLTSISSTSRPFPSFQTGTDDVQLIAGVIKYGLGAWTKIHKDQHFNLFRHLPLDATSAAAAPTASTEIAAAAASCAAGDDFLMVDAPSSATDAKIEGGSSAAPTAFDDASNRPPTPAVASTAPATPDKASADKDEDKDKEKESGKEKEKTKDGGKKKAPSTATYYNEAKLIERLRVVIRFLQDKQAKVRNQTLSIASLSSSIARSLSKPVLSSSPIKAKQATLGSGFGVEDELLSSPEPPLTMKSSPSKKRPSPNKKKLSSSNKRSSTPKKERKGAEQKKKTSTPVKRELSMDAGAKPSPNKSSTPMQVTHGVVPSDDDIDSFLSPDPPKPASSKPSTMPTKLPVVSKQSHPAPTLIAAIDDDDDDIDELVDLRPTTITAPGSSSKSQKPNGSTAAKTPQSSTNKTASTSSATKPKSKSSSKSKPSVSDSGKKSKKNPATANGSSISDFFKLKPLSLKPVTLSQPPTLPKLSASPSKSSTPSPAATAASASMDDPIEVDSD